MMLYIVNYASILDSLNMDLTVVARTVYLGL